MRYTKEDARRIVLNCSKQYRDKLLDKNLLIIYREKDDNSIHKIEVVFRDRNYQHLTGLELIDRKGNVIYNQSINFFRKCIENKLSVNEFRFKDDGTTQLKLSALPALMDITKITKITGDYNNRRPFLYVEKVIGGVNFCLGLCKEEKLYVPSSALCENIKNLTDRPNQVLAIFSKESNSKEIYSSVRHVAKGVNLNNLILPDEIRKLITLENYVYKGK